MNSIKGRRKVVFLIIGVAFTILFAAAWIVDWYLPETRLGYAFFEYVALVVYLLSLSELLFWMIRLRNEHLLQAGMIFLAASLLIFIATRLIEANYLEFFSFNRELFRGKSIEEYDQRYFMNWGYLFLYPFLYMLNGGTALLSLSAPVVCVIRRMKDAKA